MNFLGFLLSSQADLVAFIQYVNIIGCKFQLLLSLKIKLLAKIIITCGNVELISDKVTNEN